MKALLRSITPAPVRRLWRRFRGDAPKYGGMFAVYQRLDQTVYRRCDEVYGNAFRTTFEYLVGNGIHGDIAEFGTYRGYTARIMARLIREFRLPGNLWLYDSFAGLPEVESEIDQLSYEVAVKKVWYPGQMAVEEDLVAKLEKDLARIIPQQQCHIIPGNFADTLPTHLPKLPLALVHLDCGLYASTELVLSTLLDRDLLQDGTVLMFSDFNSNRASPEMGDRKAFQDAFATQRRFELGPFFPYGWNGQTFFVHDRRSQAREVERASDQYVESGR
jgi:O-methyltransferase